MDTVATHIELTPGIAGGKPRIAGHRIKVQDIVVWHERLGLGADEIATEYDLGQHTRRHSDRMTSSLVLAARARLVEERDDGPTC